jgi:hypothetical protein
VSGIAALFILVNSIAGLLGRLSTNLTFEPFLPWWLLAVVAVDCSARTSGYRASGRGPSSPRSSWCWSPQG